MTAAPDILKQLLKQRPGDLVAAVVGRIRPRLEQHRHSLILFGTGHLGRIALENLQRIGHPPVAFADNNLSLRGTTVNGIEVMPPEEARTRFPESLFCVTVYTNAPVLAQLTGMGVAPITFAELAWCYPEQFLPRAALELPDMIFSKAEAAETAFNLWTDEFSRAEYLGQLQWRSTLNRELLPPHSPVGETYFPSDIFDLSSDEVFVDCGAFDGDSIRAFLQRRGDSFRSAVGLEPDPLNRSRFEAWLATLPEAQAAKIHLLPYAVGAKSETLSFDSTGTAGSSLGSGRIEVECRPLDEVASKFHPSLIKMDIEGAEPLALRGAAQIVREQQPILAICLYHSQEHLWEIPLLIRELCPDYELFLRRYSDECWETVCYAVPPGRCKIKR